jgi:hypothetical protein
MLAAQTRAECRHSGSGERRRVRGRLAAPAGLGRRDPAGAPARRGGDGAQPGEPGRDQGPLPAGAAPDPGAQRDPRGPLRRGGADREGYGLPALEALAAGVPSAVSDIPVLAEVTGGAALLVPPQDVRAWADALALLLHDSAPRAATARAVAHAATWQRGAAVLGRLLSDVADGRLTRSGRC